jgi:hypothetical protein
MVIERLPHTALLRTGLQGATKSRPRPVYGAPRPVGGQGRRQPGNHLAESVTDEQYNGPRTRELPHATP